MYQADAIYQKENPDIPVNNDVQPGAGNTFNAISAMMNYHYVNFIYHDASAPSPPPSPLAGGGKEHTHARIQRNV